MSLRRYEEIQFDEGDSGAQTLEQSALVYPDKTAAAAAQTGLRAIADGCPATVSVPKTVTSDKNEPAYTETVKIPAAEPSAR